MKRKINEHFTVATKANEELLRSAAKDKATPVDSAAAAVVVPPSPPPATTTSLSPSIVASPPPPRSRAAAKKADAFEPLVESLFDDATMRLVFADPYLLTKAAVCASRLGDHLVVDCDAEAGVTFSQVGSSTFVRVRFERDAFVLYEMRGGGRRARSFVLPADEVRQLASLAAGAASIELIERVAAPTRLVVRLRSQKNDAFTLVPLNDNDQQDSFDLPADGFPHAFRVTLEAKAFEQLIGAAEHTKATIVSVSLSGQRLMWHAGTEIEPAKYVSMASVDTVSKLADNSPSDKADCYPLTLIQHVCGFTALATTATLSFGRAAKESPPLHIHFAFADARIGVDVLVAARQDD